MNNLLSNITEIVSYAAHFSLKLFLKVEKRNNLISFSYDFEYLNHKVYFFETWHLIKFCAK